MNQKTPAFGRWLTLLLLSSSIFSSHASIITWTNAVNGNWSNPLNWSPNQVPTTTDTAAITTAGNYIVTLDVSPNIGGLTLGTASAGTSQAITFGSQTLTVNGPIQITAQGVFNVNGGALAGTNVLTGTMSWSGGNLTGVMTITTNSALNILPGGGNDLNGFTVTNNGTINWTNAPLYSAGSSNTLIYNYGTWNVESDNSWAGGYNGAKTVFNNYGLFEKTGNGGATTLDGNVLFNNTGTISVRSGTLNISAGTNNNGDITTLGSGVANFSGFTFSNTTTIVGTGAYVDGNDVFGGTVIGTLTWDAGNISGVLTLTNSSIFNIVAGGGNSFDGLILTNRGTVNWTNAPIYGIQQLNAQIYNYGTWNAQSDNTWSGGYNGGTTTFDNIGTFVKVGQTGATTFDGNVEFTNTGTVNVQSGTVNFEAGENNGGSYITSASGAINFYNYTFTNNTTITGTNCFIAGNAIFGGTVTGTLTWDGGNLAGALNLAGGSVFNIVAGGGDSFDGFIMTNRGTVNWTNTTIYGINQLNAQIYNLGTWNAESDNTWQGGYNGGTTLFKNTGTFVKSGGSGSITLDTSIVFANSGTIQVKVGTLNIDGGVTTTAGGGNGGVSTGGTIRLSTNTVINFNNYIFGGPTTVIGTGIMTLGGNTTLNGTISVTNLEIVGGEISGNSQLTGNLTWSGGGLDGALLINSNSTMSIISGGGDGFNGLALTNFGLVTWTNTTIYGLHTSNALVYNYGTWIAQSDNDWQGGYNGGVTLFDNFGSFVKSGNSGTTTLDGSVNFYNTGTVTVNSGTLNIIGRGTNSNGSFFTSGTGIIDFENYLFTNNTTFSGTGSYIAGSCNFGGIVAGPLTWDGGNISGVLTLTNTGVFNIIAGGGDSFNGLILTNHGTVNWTNAAMYGINGLNAQIYNYGTWNAQSDNSWQGGYNGGTSLFDNFGNFNKTGLTGTTSLDANVIFNNTGTVNVEKGTLTLNNGSKSGSGTFIVPAGAALNLNNIDLEDGTSVSGDGTVSIGGTSTITGATTISNLNLVGGVISGNNTLTGSVTWSGGRLSGVMIIASNSTFDIVSGGGDGFSGLVMTNYGTVDWTNTSLYGLSGGNAQIYNYGTWDAQSDNSWSGGYNGGITLFENFGTFVKTGSTGTTTLDGSVLFNNTGTVSVESGTLAMNGGGTNNDGSFATSGDGVTDIDVYTFTNNTAFNGASNFIDGNTVFAGTVTGAVSWNGGSVSGVLTLLNNGIFNIISGGGNGFVGLTLTNYGTVNWGAAPLYGRSDLNAAIYNYGTWYALSDQSFDGGYNGGSSLFDNFGWFVKSGTTATTTIENDVQFNNMGTLDSQSGTISLSDYSLTGGTLDFGLSSLTNFGQITLAGTAPLTGTLSANLIGGFVPAVGNTFDVLNFTASSGLFTATNLPAAAVWKTIYNPANVSIQVQLLRPPLFIQPSGSSVVLSWPTTFPGYSVQQTASLAPISWSAVTNPITTVGTNYNVTVTSTNGIKYYELIGP